MKYELAKELKDGGFPQNPFHHPGMYSYETKGGEGRAYAPTLEELIEACGESFEMFDRFGKGWRAVGANSTAYGATPTEAVARLWLALNKKS